MANWLFKEYYFLHLSRVSFYSKGGNCSPWDDFILWQIIPALNVPVDIESQVCAEDEVKLIRPLYDFSTREFKVIAKTLAYIMVRGMKMEHFFSYHFSQDKLRFFMLM